MLIHSNNCFLGAGDEADTLNACSALFSVLMTSVRVMAPFTPFIVETMYQNLRKVLPKDQQLDSVHYEEVFI